MSAKQRIVMTAQKWLVNPITKPLAGRFPGLVLLETIGRRSGRPRRTPVGAKQVGDTLWIVAEHGHGANYVRNIKKNPRVLVRIDRRWRKGRATIQPDDDPRRRLRKTPNDVMVRLMASDLLILMAVSSEQAVEPVHA